MKMNKWTMGLAAAGVVSLASTAQAEENSVLTALSSTVISGNVEASYVGGFSTNNNLHNDGGFQANGASISIGSPLGEGDYSAGYNVELLFGDRGEAFGNSASYLKNANIGLNAPFGNGVDLTVGLFDTIVGYEVEASGSNPNLIRSYGYNIEPFSHTGLLASTTLTDGLSVSAGLTNGFDAAGDSPENQGHSKLGYLVSAELTAPDSLGFLAGSTVYVGHVAGNNQNATGGVNDADDDSLTYVGASIASPIEGLSLGLAYDDRTFQSGVEASALAGYAVYQLSDGLNVALRYDTINFDAGAGGEDNVESIAVTLGYQMWENVLTRLEFGWENGAGAIATAASDAVGRFADTNRNAAGEATSEIGSSSYFALNLFYQF